MDKKTHVICITRDLILEEGLQSASMSKIGKVSGVAIGTIYNLFPSKEILINEVYLYSRNKFLDVYDTKLNQENTTFKEALMHLLENYIEKALNNKNDYLFVEQYHLSSTLNEDTRLPDHITLGNLLLDEAIKECIVKPLPPALFTSILLGVINKPISAHFAGLVTIDNDTKKMLLAIAWDAIKYI